MSEFSVSGKLGYIGYDMADLIRMDVKHTGSADFI
jgi:hypothetical protein